MKKKDAVRTSYVPNNSTLYISKTLSRARAVTYREPVEDQNITVKPMTKRRKQIFEGKENIDRKKIFEMIEEGNPSGLEILERVSRSPTEFQDLIYRAFEEFYEMKRLQDEQVKLHLEELKAREPEILEELEKYQKMYDEKNEEKRQLNISIVAGKYNLKTINAEANRLCTLLESDKRKLKDIDTKEVDSQYFVDDTSKSLEERVDMYIKERERLENLFDEKEKLLEQLNAELQNVCKMKTKYKQPK